MSREALFRVRWRTGRPRSDGLVVGHRSCPRGKDGEEQGSRQPVGHGREGVGESGRSRQLRHRHHRHRGDRRSNEEDCVYGSDPHRGGGCSHGVDHGGGRSSRPQGERRIHHGEEGENESGSGRGVEACVGFQIEAVDLSAASNQEDKKRGGTHIRDTADSGALELGAIELIDGSG